MPGLKRDEVEVGDRVVVTHKHDNWLWVKSMDVTIGMHGRILGLSQPDAIPTGGTPSARVALDNGEAYLYPLQCLEAEPRPKSIREGDRVEITSKYVIGIWADYWVDDMDETIGTRGRVNCVTPAGTNESHVLYFQVTLDTGDTWNYPLPSVRKIPAEPKPVTEERLEELSLTEVIDECHEIAREKGWWDTEKDFATLVANLHGEASEAWEWYRKGGGPSDHIPEFSGVEEELADICIRIFDYAAGEGLRLEAAILAKMGFNRTREYRHGGKKA